MYITRSVPPFLWYVNVTLSCIPCATDSCPFLEENIQSALNYCGWQNTIETTFKAKYERHGKKNKSKEHWKRHTRVFNPSESTESIYRRLPWAAFQHPAQKNSWTYSDIWWTESVHQQIHELSWIIVPCLFQCCVLWEWKHYIRENSTALASI